MVSILVAVFGPEDKPSLHGHVLRLSGNQTRSSNIKFDAADYAQSKPQRPKALVDDASMALSGWWDSLRRV
jgi:hypothetical protein